MSSPEFPAAWVTARPGNLLTTRVEEFARRQRLYYESWYHDMPVWIIRDGVNPQPGELTRRVQISIIEDPTDGLQIEVIPNVYVYSQEETDVRLEVPMENRIEKSSKLPLIHYSSKRLPRGFKKALEQAWKFTQEIKAEDLTERVKIPSR